ncbi:MAG: 2-hydroxyacyl-CoA dehydratase subunit D [Lachnospiraceae bacterium]
MKSDMLQDYTKEYMETLETLKKKNSRLKQMQYFFDIGKYWFDKQMRRTYKPKLVVLGPGVPEEIVWASGCAPFWVLGGSHSAVNWSDDRMPRDADPVHRSIMGFLCEEDGVDYSDALFIIPVNCDSMRKIAYMLSQEGREVFPLDLPPEKTDRFAQEKWKLQIRKMTEVIEKHLKKKLSAKKILEAERALHLAKTTLRNFLSVTENQEEIISGSARLYVQNSYYYTNNLIEWTNNLSRLTQEIQKDPMYGRTASEKPQVLLLGSPVYFPNYKIPFLIEDIGLSIYKNIDVASFKLYDAPLKVSNLVWKEEVLDAIAERFLQTDASSAYAENETMRHMVDREIQGKRIDGVVYHILKGQIEYDFELSAFEEMFEERGIPVFRLETDYQYQDVEQLRIRMEAFSEMLNQKKVVRDQEPIVRKRKSKMSPGGLLQTARALLESMSESPVAEG